MSVIKNGSPMALSFDCCSVVVFLNDAKSIVRHSFCVHRSILHLDLSMCEYSLFKSNMKKQARIERHSDNPISVKSNFICTAESSKKDLAKSRRLLYTLHLDLGSKLESSPRYSEKKNEFDYCYDGIILNGLATPPRMYERLLHQMITNVLQKTQQAKYLKGIIKVVKLVDFPKRSVLLLNRCLEILHSQLTDSIIVHELVAAIPLEESDLLFLKPSILEFLLQHVDRMDCNDSEFRLRQEWIYSCIFYCKFEQVSTLLKFYNTPKFSESTYLKIMKSLQITSGLPSWEMKTPVERGWITEERCLLILQVLDIYYGVFAFFENSRLSCSGVEAMRLIWRSIPDIFISLEELVLLYGETRISRDIKSIHGLYTDIVQDNSLFPQPRKLQDYCRVTIRNVLAECQQLPEGIGGLKLPSRVQSFLKLEK